MNTYTKSKNYSPRPACAYLVYYGENIEYATYEAYRAEDFAEVISYRTGDAIAVYMGGILRRIYCKGEIVFTDNPGYEK